MENNLISTSELNLENQLIQIFRKRKRTDAGGSSVNKYQCVDLPLIFDKYISLNRNLQFTDLQYPHVTTPRLIYESQVRIPGRGADKQEHRDWPRHQYSLNSQLRSVLHTPICRNLQRTDALLKKLKRSEFFDDNFELKFMQRIAKNRKERRDLLQKALSEHRAIRAERLACEKEMANLKTCWSSISIIKHFQMEKMDRKLLFTGKQPLDKAKGGQFVFKSVNFQNEEYKDLEFPPITEQMKKRYNDIVCGQPFAVVVSKFNMDIKRSSIGTLIGCNWLDDEVINFYMNLITERSTIPENNLPSVYCMNTFFNTRLCQLGYTAVSRWTRKIDLFSKDIIVVPIHVNNNHWCMAIIHLKNKTIQYYDSMGSGNRLVLIALEKYLKAESLDKRKVAFDTSEFLIRTAQDTPRQRNISDCGVFSCMIAEYITRNQPLTFTQRDVPYFRKKMVMEIIEAKLWLPQVCR